MGFINCEKCGRQISDQWNVCPWCANLITKVQPGQSTEVENESSKVTQEKPQYVNKEFQDIVDATHIPKHKPIFNGCLLAVLPFFLMCIAYGVIVFAPNSRNLDQDDMEASIFLFIVLLLGSIIGICIGIWMLREQRAQYDALHNNPEEYRKQLALESYQGVLMERQEQERKRQQKAGYRGAGITCPYCHGTNVSRISTASRMASTTMVGMASKKIGKQWHCNNCGSDF